MLRKPLRDHGRARVKDRPSLVFCFAAVVFILLNVSTGRSSRSLLKNESGASVPRQIEERRLLPASFENSGKPVGSVHENIIGHSSVDEVNAGASVCDGIVACVSIHVFAYKRVEATQRLLNTLEASDYSGYDKVLPLVVHLDGPAPGDDLNTYATVHDTLRDFKWSHGPLHLDISNKHRGLKDSWLSAWTKPGPDDVMIAFEDDIDVSPHYFQWLLKVLKQYDLQLPGARDQSLLGVSLSPMLVDEISYPFMPWWTHENVPAEYPVFLHAVPSSWGVAYFGGPWRDFLAFARTRATRSFYDLDEASLNLTSYGWHTPRGDPNLWLPDSRSNNWVKSWKRFMVEFAYGRGAYTIYPNLAGSSGLATSTFLQGEHVLTSGHNHRIAPLASIDDLGLNLQFPGYDKLPLKDMHGKDITRADLSRQGDSFIAKIDRLGLKYADLVTAWRRPCLLDSVSVQSNLYGDQTSGYGQRKSSPSDAGYLLVYPQMGFSNQLIALMHSAVWAHVLRRKLVLPHIFWPRASGDFVTAESWIPFHEVFASPSITKHLPGLEAVHADPDILAGWHPSRVVSLEPTPSFDKLHYVYADAFGWSLSETVDLLPHRPVLNSVDRLYQNLGSCDDRVMVLNGLFKDPVTQTLPGTFWRSLWKEMFGPTPLVKHLTKTARRALLGDDASHQTTSAFGCLHVRLGDFSGVCSAPENSAPWLEHLYAAGRHCHVSLDTVADRARSLGVDKILIISDEPEKLVPILADINIGTVWTGLDVQAVVKEILPRIRPHPSAQMVEVFAALTEQHLCAEADRVVLNSFSTFSRSVSHYMEGDEERVEWW